MIRPSQFLACMAILVATLSGCSNSSDTLIRVTPAPDGRAERTRYEFNNRCVVLQSVTNNRFVTLTDGVPAATSTAISAAEPFYFKPTGLGDYLLFTRNSNLLAAGATPSLNPLTAPSDANIFTLRVAGDTTNYVRPPLRDNEPTPAEIAAYRNFVDPERKGGVFTLDGAAGGQRLQSNAEGVLSMAAPAPGTGQQFRLVLATGCAEFPEAQNNASGDTFSGRTADGRVLGMADVHVHLSATNFLGNAQYGDPFHKFGVTHALGDCAGDHGPQGSMDVVGAALASDTDGHATDGWPTFSAWPSRDSLTHEAIYWKWLERAWMAGLRIMVNDVVENETLCELQRNVTRDVTRDCNEMNSAARQVGTLYAMQDYIDAQYGGRGKGWFRIVLSPQEARSVIEQGKLALVIGIEISNLLDCKVKYNPLRQQEPFQETGTGETENSYTCTEASVKEQIARLVGLGVRQVITIHEFDNAFGGNGIFDGLVLNLGNRENSGGIPSGDLAKFSSVIPQTAAGVSPLGYIQSAERPTGEFWTTYDCPEEDPATGFDYLWGSQGGASMTSVSTLTGQIGNGFPAFSCPFAGQGGRPGGLTPCYPAKRQCNARWMTPMGLFAYREIMKTGLIFDIDHLEHEMKTQALELAEAQPIPYPFVSTHGTFGGTSTDQALRILKNGGYLYPSLGNSPSLIADLRELRKVWEKLPNSADKPRPLFGFGFGTDTNGLSAQASPRGNVPDAKAVKYPFTLFTGAIFSQLPDFNGMKPVVFRQPEERDAAGNGRKWSLDEDGSAHYGMLADFVEEMRKEGTAQDMQDVFNSAERYLRTWERTREAAAAIPATGALLPGKNGKGQDLLRAAPRPASPLPLP